MKKKLSIRVYTKFLDLYGQSLKLYFNEQKLLKNLIFQIIKNVYT